MVFKNHLSGGADLASLQAARRIRVLEENQLSGALNLRSLPRSLEDSSLGREPAERRAGPSLPPPTS